MTGDGFQVRITTLTPLPKRDWEREERLLDPCGRAKAEPPQRGDRKSQESHEREDHEEIRNPIESLKKQRKPVVDDF